ncbi:acyl-CoA synthetase [Microbacterium sp. YY-03]|uniref:acyl-CoA synthetase n=1 Tax=Microbacterium sp. YY-03 TaxID=3421636 RepID=UPI003D17C22F
MPAAKTPTFTVRHLQLARALFAAMAAVMITFTSDHSAAIGLAAFSGFAVASGLVWGLSAWLIYPAGRRAVPVLLALVNGAAGIIASSPMNRTTTMFFVIVITWAAITTIVEGWWALYERRGAHAAEAKDSLGVAIITAVLLLAIALIQPTFALEYFNETINEGGTLTGITIAVGVFGGYAAIIAVYLGIAGFSPKNDVVAPDTATTQEVSS